MVDNQYSLHKNADFKPFYDFLKTEYLFSIIANKIDGFIIYY